MEIGKVSENVLKRAVFQQIKHLRPEVLLHPGIGEDCSAIEVGPDEVLVFSTDPITGATKGIGSLAVHITANDLASSGAEPIGILVCAILPPRTREKKLHDLMEELTATANQLNIEVIGGHTEISDVVNRPVITVTGVGKAKKGQLISTAGLCPGDELVMTKWAGLEGTSIIAAERREELSERLPEQLLDAAEQLREYISVIPEAAVAVQSGATAMHDVTEGGIFGALWEMGEASDVGIIADLEKIPIRQETVEICEFYGINPYMLISSGCMLIGTKQGNLLVEQLQEKGIPAAVIGRATQDNDRIIRSGEEKRFLEPAGSDQLYQVDRRER